MDHLRFESDQAAAAYVADGLDPERRQEFELHMMSCPECVEAVEGWRAIKDHLPHDLADSATGRHEQTTGTDIPSRVARKPRASASKTSTPQAPRMSGAVSQMPSPAGARWRLASMLAAGLIAGTAGGWYGRSAEGPSLDTRSIGFYSLPPLSRGPADCTSVRLGSHVLLLALRIPGSVPDQRLVAVDSEGHDLSPEDYSVQTQGDGSWLVRVRAATVREQDLRFEARSADGTVEPRGCVVSASRA
jgi:hypothetical protein